MAKERIGTTHEKVWINYWLSSKQYPAHKGLATSLQTMYYMGKVCLQFFTLN
jgi:hypothetical protein